MARKEKTIHYIYKTTCNITGKWYIGMHSTYNLEDGYMGSGKILRYSIRKHGIGNHTKEILEFLSTREALVLREIEIVNKELIGDGKCMNLKEGGSGGFSSEEHMNNCSKAGVDGRIKKWGENIEFVNKTKSILLENVKHCHKIGKYNYNTFEGKNHSVETKELISQIKKGTGVGETNSQYGTCWITKNGTNKKIKKENLLTYLNEGWLKGRK